MPMTALTAAGIGIPYSTGGSPGAGARDLKMSTAFTMTAPSGGISPSSASMRVSSVAQPPLSGDGDAVAPPSGLAGDLAAVPSLTPPSGGGDAGASSNARYARGVTTVNPGAARMISRSSRRGALP